ncbi:MAG: peptidoglycan-binding domain-containing protein [Pseudorhodobacter sp.]
MAVLAEPETSSAVVHEAQKLLNKSALQTRAPENGAFDKTTLAAIKQFQVESGLKPTGVLDDKLMKILRDAANRPNPTKQIKIGSKIYLFTDAEYAQLVKRIAREFETAMIQLRGAVAEARGIWDNQNALNKDQYIVAWCIEAYKGVKLPPESLIKTAESGVKAADAALKSGNLQAFSKIFPKAEQQANDARVKMKTYLSKIIDGGESLVTGLQIVSTTSFVIVGIIAAPVAASYGAGAVGAAVIAGAGTSAVESLAHEVGKGISGDSKGIGDASFNVLRDSFIGGSVGALVKGKAGEKIIAKIGPMVAKQLSGKLFEKASEKAVTSFLISYFKKNGADILEGVITDVIKEYKSNAGGLTFDKFTGIVAKQVATAGIFGKFGKAGDVGAKAVFGKLSGSVKKDLIKSLGANAKEADLLPIFSKVFEETSKEMGGKIYDKVLSSATGSESPDQIEAKLLGEFATNKKLIDAVRAEAEAKARKSKR